MQVYNAFAVKLHNLYAGGLIIISLVILQDFFSLKPLDPPAYLAVLSFAIALPLLSGTLVLNVIEEHFKFGPAKSPVFRVVHYTFFASILLALIGIAAAFWHVSWVIGLVFMSSQALAISVYGMYIIKLNEHNPDATRKGA